MTDLLDRIPDLLRPWVDQALPVWMGGGWAMIPLAATGLIMYALGLSALFQLLLLGARSSPDRAWRRWQKDPARCRGPIGTLITQAMSCRSLHDMQTFFSLLASEGITPFARRLQIMKVCVTSAPLLGLLGTVTGMLTTFQGLSKGGGDQTMAVISKGISEALITTETGLVVALTGLMIQFFLTRQQQRYEKVVAHIETLCMRDFQLRHDGVTRTEAKS